PVILFSHASNSGFAEAPVAARVGRAAASNGATSPPRPKAAALAAIRPKKPRRCVVERPSSNMRPPLSMGALWTRVRAPSRARPHAAADVVCRAPPQGRPAGRPRPRRAVTLRAAGGVHRRPRRRVRRQLGPLLEPIARRGGLDRDVARQKPEVRNDVPHLGAVDGERRAVHAAPEAVVHAVLNRFDRRAAGAVLRVARVDAHPRAHRVAAARVEVTADATQVVADVTRQAVAGGKEEGATTLDRGAERAGGDQGGGGTVQRRWSGRATVARRGVTARHDAQPGEAGRVRLDGARAAAAAWLPIS